MAFDPYYTWLGIRPDESAGGGPNHYRLLGLSLFEDNAGVIDNAADRQMAHVRTFQTGPHAAASQRLLSEITLARLTLLNPQKRSAYDAELRKKLQPPAPPPPAVAETQPIVVTVPPELTGLNERALAPAVSTAGDVAGSSRRQKNPALELAKIVAGGLAGLALSVLLLRYVAGIDITGLMPVPKQVSAQKLAQQEQVKVTKTPASTSSKPTTQGQGQDAKTADTLVIYNTRNWTYGGGGTKVCAIELRKGSSVVWRKDDIPLAWDRQSNPATRIDVPSIDYDVLRINVIKWVEGGRAGLSEVELIRNGRNVLLHRPAIASEPYDLPGKCTAQMAVDGIRDEVAQGGDGMGYWLLPKSEPGWIEISLTGDLTAKAGSSARDASDVAKKGGKKSKKKAPTLSPSPHPTSSTGTVSSSTGASSYLPVLQPRRLTIPPAAEQEVVKATLEELYGLSKLKSEAEKLKVAGDLRRVAGEANERPAEQFAALRQAAELAQEVGDAKLLAQCIDEMAQRFEIDLMLVEATMFAQCAKNARTAEAIESLVVEARPVILFALGEGEFEAAKRLTDATMAACARPSGLKYRKSVSDGQKEVNRLHSAWQDFEQALQKLQAQPDDGAANLTAGKWLCFERADWEAALPYLARAGNLALQQAAELELSKPIDALGQLAAADAWYDAGAAGPKESLWHLRARLLYSQAKRGPLDGLAAAKVERRLDELAKDGDLKPLVERYESAAARGRLRTELSPIVRRHCVLAFAFEPADFLLAADKPTLRDLSGQENHGMVHGTSLVAGRAGSAFGFQAEEDYVESPDQPSLNPEAAFTICAWIYQHSPVRPGGADDIVSKEEFGGGTGSGFSLRLHDRKPDINFGSGPQWLTVRAPQIAETGKWLHLAGVYNGEHEALFVDGVEVASAPCAQLMSASPRPIRVGRGPFAQDRRFHGVIDEVAMFDIGLTADDVRLLYDLGKAGTPLSK
jgi:hypothetical protein